MNKHPNATIGECSSACKDGVNTRKCYNNWQRYIQPLQFLYFLLDAKFIPITKLSRKEIEKLKDIEIRLDLHVISRRYNKVYGKRRPKETQERLTKILQESAKKKTPCPYCKKEYSITGIESHKRHCTKKDEKKRT